MFLNVKRFNFLSFRGKTKTYCKYLHQTTRICISKTPPPSPESDSEEPNEHNDPVLKKMYYIDPGMMSYKRSTFESLFYKIPSPMDGQELKSLAKGHRLKFSIDGDIIVLLIFNHLWNDANDVIWDNMAELLSDWSSETILRESLPVLLSSETVFDGKEHISIPLKVKHHPPPESKSSQ